MSDTMLQAVPLAEVPETPALSGGPVAPVVHRKRRVLKHKTPKILADKKTCKHCGRKFAFGALMKHLKKLKRAERVDKIIAEAAPPIGVVTSAFQTAMTQQPLQLPGMKLRYINESMAEIQVGDILLTVQAARRREVSNG